MDRLDAMKLFVRVVERGNFSGAAREIGIGQPAVSKQIASLETYLGAQLLVRSSRRLTLTDAGRDFFQSASRLIVEFELAESSVGRRLSSPAGRVRVNIAPGFGEVYVTPRLPTFLRRYPEVSVDLLVSERSADLVEDSIDVAVRHGELADSRLVARKIGSTPVIFAASASYLASRGEPTKLDDLASHSCVVFIGANGPQRWRFSGNTAPVSYVPEGQFRTNDSEQVRAAVLSGIGIAQAPMWLFDADLKSGSVVRILRSLEPSDLPISAVRPANRKAATRVSIFIDFLAESLAETKSPSDPP
jgi:LysR family transcriptional regulator for bpeEF and oprC